MSHQSNPLHSPVAIGYGCLSYGGIALLAALALWGIVAVIHWMWLHS